MNTFSTDEKETLFSQFIVKASEVMTPSQNTVTDSLDIIDRDLYDYTKAAGLESLCLGISGGLDSAVVAAIASKVTKRLGIKLIGVSIPLSSSDKHREQAAWVGETYCDAFSEINAWEEIIPEAETTPHEMVDSVINSTDRVLKMAGFEPNDFDRAIQQANIKSRLRMITLYAIAKNAKGMVLGTGNWSEDHAIFFYTIGGDGQVDYSPIKGIGKGFEMPVFAKELGIRDDIIDQKPSDGLKASEADTDEAQIGGTYEEVDAVINAYLGNFGKELTYYFSMIEDLEKVQKIIGRHKANKFKENGEVSIERGENGLPEVFME